MTPWIEYLIKLSVSLSVVSLFYQIVLRRLTFYDWNRWYFLVFTLLSFVIPLIDISRSMPEETSRGWVSTIPSIHRIGRPALAVATELPAETFDIEKLGLCLVLAGIAAMTVRFLLNLLSYARLRRNARLISEDEVKIYHLEKQVNPFSFGDSIFYNPDLHEPDELKDIILHEYVHVRQKHSFDVLWSELLCIVNWYNPFAWLIRYFMRQNLEFIADRKVLEGKVDARRYQYLLLKVAGVPAYRIVNQFSFSSLKQRIIMMNKGKSPQVLLGWFLVALPLIALLVVTFRKEISDFTDQKVTEVNVAPPTSSEKKTIHVAGLILNAETNQPIPHLALKMTYNEKYVKTLVTDENGFYYQKVSIPKHDSLQGVSPKGFGKKFRISSHSIMLAYEGNDYVQFALGDESRFDTKDEGFFPVVFAVPGQEQHYRPEFYGLGKNKFFVSYTGNNTRKGVYESLTEILPKFVAEHNLRADFRKAYHFPKNVITKFHNAYFDRQKNLLAYEGKIEFLLNGKKATYQQINDAFRDYPYELSPNNEFRSWAKDGYYDKIAYLTLPLYKDAAPGYLVRGNVQWQNTQDFDLEVLSKEPYFLDGFRQIYGTGSNMVPLKEEIIKVALFTGKLARYYDPGSDRVWWVETRPEPEVFGRPDLAMIK